MEIEIYTDGSSKGNPGPGGWGAIIIEVALRQAQGDFSNQELVTEIGGREEHTTNNKMELRAAIEGLRATPENSNVKIHTDSEYLMKGATLWIHGWLKNNWRTSDKKSVMNQDLWQELLIEIRKRKVTWEKVLGHSGHALNDRCDEIATSFADGHPTELYRGAKENYKLK